MCTGTGIIELVFLGSSLHRAAIPKLLTLLFVLIVKMWDGSHPFVRKCLLGRTCVSFISYITCFIWPFCVMAIEDDACGRQRTRSYYSAIYLQWHCSQHKWLDKTRFCTWYKYKLELRKAVFVYIQQQYALCFTCACIYFSNYYANSLWSDGRGDVHRCLS